MTTWAGIVRVSHMGDRKADDHDFHAGRDQVSAIERGVPHGGTLHILPPELDVSGGLTLERRPSLLAAIEGVEQGEYAGIIVAYLSRLGRNTREQLRAWDRVEAAGGRIICVAENIDTATPSGRFMRTVMLANAEREREEHVDRFDNLRRWATEAGIPALPNVPKGYVRDETSRQLIPGPDAALVCAAFDARAAGEPVVKIAQRLGMSAQGARYLLSNRVYLGELRSGRYVNPTAHPAIVDVATFEAAQRKVSRPARSHAFDGAALLTGLVRCSGCGHLMTRNRSTSKPMYRCPVYHSGARCPTPGTITCESLDAYVEGIALAMLDHLRVTVATGEGADRAQEAHERAIAERDAYLAATSALGNIEAFAAGAASRQATVDATRQQWMAEMTQRRVVPKMDTLNADERNALMRSLFEVVIVAAVGRGRRVPVEQRARVLEIGTPVTLPQRSGGRSAGLVPLPLPDFDQPGVLRVPLTEDGLQGAGGRGQVRAQAATG